MGLIRRMGDIAGAGSTPPPATQGLAAGRGPADRPTVLRALPAALDVAVVAQDERLALRAAVALEREGLAARVETGGRFDLEPDRLTRRPDVVLLAGSDPAAFGPSAHRIRRRLPDVQVVLVIGAERPSARHVLDAGVHGIVLEAELEATLGIAVRAVCAGQLTLPREMRHGVAPPAFSHRERQILRLVVAGFTNEQIAARLYLAKSTVAGHLTPIFRTLGVRSREEAVTLILTGDESLRASVLGPEPASAEVPDAAGCDASA
jgi:two-component system, NarL family, response regulator LiaR